MILAFLAAAATPLPPSTPPGTPARTPDACAELAMRDPAAAEREAAAGVSTGSIDARLCLGLALAQQNRFADAARAFEEAARAGELKRDPYVGGYWAQAGNAWLAAGEAAKAQGALGAALASATLTGTSLGEAHLDRARALVALGNADAARVDLDAALQAVPDDPLGWLLSATLARRMADLPRARTDIAEALRRSADDASVQLEAGNIAAASGDATRAKAAWTEAARLAPAAPAGLSAANALKQFGADPAP